MNHSASFVLDRRKLSFLNTEVEVVPSWKQIRGELSIHRAVAQRNFAPANKTRSLPSQPPPTTTANASVAAADGTATGTNGSRVIPSSSSTAQLLLLLDSNGQGGLTRSVAVLETLLGARKGDEVLVCIPYKSGDCKNGTYETYRRICNKRDLVYSTFTAAGRKNGIPILQIPARVESNVDGEKVFGGGGGSTEESIAFLNAEHQTLGLSVSFFKNGNATHAPRESSTTTTTTTTTTTATTATPSSMSRNSLHNYKILFKDVLLGEFHIRRTEFNVPFPSFRSLFTGTTAACVCKYNYGMVKQLLMESRGDPLLTLSIISDFENEYWQKACKQLKRGSSSSSSSNPAKPKNHTNKEVAAASRVVKRKNESSSSSMSSPSRSNRSSVDRFHCPFSPTIIYEDGGAPLELDRNRTP